MTPITAGTAVTRRSRKVFSMPAPSLQSRPRVPGPEARSVPSGLDQSPIVEPAVEPVLVARHVLLHGDVDVGLEQRHARDVGEGELDEAADIPVVGGGV